MSDAILSLEGRVAIVTGAARGIGAAAAKAVAGAGATVMIGDVLEDELAATACEIGRGVLAQRLDVTDASLWSEAVKLVMQRFGRLDVLVNNAAIVEYERFENTSVQSLRRILEVNVVGTFLGMQAVLPHMKRARRGSIINISSAAGLMGLNTLSAYAASKWAVRGLSRSAALELGEHGIRVNTIHPAAIDTAMTHPSGLSQEEFSKRSSNVPMGRWGQADEVADAILYLACDASSFTTGSELLVDGGMCAGQRIFDRTASRAVE